MASANTRPTHRTHVKPRRQDTVCIMLYPVSDKGKGVLATHVAVQDVCAVRLCPAWTIHNVPAVHRPIRQQVFGSCFNDVKFR